MQHLGVDFIAAIAEELDEVRHLDTGLLRQAPEFGRERDDANLLEGPIDQPALDRLLLVVGEVIEDADAGYPVSSVPILPIILKIC